MLSFDQAMKSSTIKKKRIIVIAVIMAALYGVSKVKLVDYLLMQAAGQIEVLWNARPLDEVLLDEEIDDGIKQNIQLIGEIKAFASAELGLTSHDLYQTIYDQKGEDILWNLSACEPFELKCKEWYFPIVGSVSYKGFFDLNKAKIEEQSLKEKGYDTRIRPVNAWSTLGWFSDPVLSNNLLHDKGRIAELFIHEITHANIFVKDSLTFNENLASFIGEQGAKMFMAKKFGQDSEEYIDYIQDEKDIQKFIKHCLIGLERLDSLYVAFDPEWSVEMKKTAKEKCIRQWVADLDTITFFDGDSFQGRFEDKLPNNAFFMSFERYDSKKIIFEKMLLNEFSGDLKSFIDFYKQLD